MTQYKISELADLLRSNKTHIRRLIIRNGILAVNEDTREQGNHAKEYNEEAKTLLEAYLVSAKERTQAQNEAIQRNMKRNTTQKRPKQADLDQKPNETLQNESETRQTTNQRLIDDELENEKKRFRNDSEVIKLLEKQIEQARLDKLKLEEDKNKEIEKLLKDHEIELEKADLYKQKIEDDKEKEMKRLIGYSEEQIEQAKIENKRIQEDKNKEIERLINNHEKQIEQANLDKATLSRHLDQQQVISLNSQKQIETLQLELKGNTKVEETKGSDEEQEEKRTLFSIFKRKK